jgi:hypothetical protein
VSDERTQDGGRRVQARTMVWAEGVGTRLWGDKGPASGAEGPAL